MTVGKKSSKVKAMLDYLIFHRGGYFADQEFLIIKNSNKETVTIDCYSRPRTWKKESCLHAHCSINQEMFSKCQRIFDKVNIASWRASYSDDDVLDGEQWSVSYKVDGDNERRISGSNSYPDNWQSFVSCIEYIKTIVGTPVEEDISSMVQIAYPSS